MSRFFLTSFNETTKTHVANQPMHVGERRTIQQRTASSLRRGKSNLRVSFKCFLFLERVITKTERLLPVTFRSFKLLPSSLKSLLTLPSLTLTGIIESRLYIERKDFRYSLFKAEGRESRDSRVTWATRCTTCTTSMRWLLSDY